MRLRAEGLGLRFAIFSVFDFDFDFDLNPALGRWARLF